MLTELLDQADEWHFVQGSKHWKLYVNNQFAGILPYGKKQTTDARPMLNAKAQINRILRLTA